LQGAAVLGAQETQVFRVSFFGLQSMQLSLYAAGCQYREVVIRETQASQIG
jgi:hypothetical protein